MPNPTTTSTVAVTDLLREQHETVRQMFDALESLEGDERAELFACLRRTLAVHETAEEMVVYPAARELGGDAASVADARIAEEDEAKQALADLEKLGPDGDGFGVQLLSFRRAVEEHAEAEEDELFPLLDRGHTIERLRQLADSVLVVEDMAPTHPHPHRPQRALGNLLVGPFAAMADKVRDRLAAR